jgi:uncharacterized protein
VGTAVRSGWLSDALDALVAGDTAAWTELYSDDAVHEFPYAPEPFPGRLEGKAAIGEYMRHLPDMVKFTSFDDVRVHEADEDQLIVEVQSRGHLVADDAPFHMSYVWFITFRDGLVTNFRDYMNPLELPPV